MPPSTVDPQPSPSVVLDTNVVLDLFVFGDAVAAPLLAAFEAGALTAWGDVATLAELEHVIRARHIRPDLGEAERSAAVARYRARVRLTSESSERPLPELPRCRDRDDQKFLVLAARAGAAWLVSKDKRLLSLADRHGLPFVILTPRQAVARLGAQVAG